jgi:hypothetical protein
MRKEFLIGKKINESGIRLELTTWFFYLRMLSSRMSHIFSCSIDVGFFLFLQYNHSNRKKKVSFVGRDILICCFGFSEQAKIESTQIKIISY